MLFRSPGDLAWALGLATVKIVVALGLIFFVGQQLMSRWFHIVAARRSQELFMLNLLLVTLGMAALTERLGLSMALGAFMAGVLLSAYGPVHADAYPAKPIRMLVPFPPGGGGDIVARVVAQKFTERWGQQEIGRAHV